MKRLEQLYHAYSRNLSLHDSALKDTFACPICLRKFSKDAVQSRILTEEHVISQKLGGRIVTLTCKECNNLHGSTLDSNLINKFRALDRVSGLSDKPLRSQVKALGAKQDLETYFSREGPPRIHFIGNEKRSNPTSVRKILDAIRDNTEEVSFHLDLGFNPLRANVAKLRAAYLLMFRYFGYEYILNENVEIVRQQLLNPDQDLIASRATLGFKALPEEVNSICLVRSPSELRCFVAIINVSTEIDRSFGVILPGLQKDRTHIYDIWNSTAKSGSNLRLDVTYFLPNPNAPEEYIYENTVTNAWE